MLLTHRYTYYRKKEMCGCTYYNHITPLPPSVVDLLIEWCTSLATYYRPHSQQSAATSITIDNNVDIYLRKCTHLHIETITYLYKNYYTYKEAKVLRGVGT